MSRYIDHWDIPTSEEQEGVRKMQKISQERAKKMVLVKRLARETGYEVQERTLRRGLVWIHLDEMEDHEVLSLAATLSAEVRQEQDNPIKGGF